MTTVLSCVCVEKKYEYPLMILPRISVTMEQDKHDLRRMTE